MFVKIIPRDLQLVFVEVIPPSTCICRGYTSINLCLSRIIPHGLRLVFAKLYLAAFHLYLWGLCLVAFSWYLLGLYLMAFDLSLSGLYLAAFDLYTSGLYLVTFDLCLSGLDLVAFEMYLLRLYYCSLLFIVSFNHESQALFNLQK